MQDRLDSPQNKIAADRLNARHEVFDALPVPALLFDTEGRISDVNRSMLESERSDKPTVQIQDYLGRPVFECIRAPGSSEQQQQWLKVLLHEGAVEPLVGEIETGADQALLTLRASALRTPDGQITGGLLLREILVDRRSRQSLQRAILEVREQIWSMRQSEDIQHVMNAVRDALRQLDVPFEGCGVNLVEREAEHPSVWFHTMHTDGTWSLVGPDVEGSDIVIDIWRKGQTVYRTDLNSEDTLGEGDNIEADFGIRIRSVIDVPFSHGTLAVNNTQPHAFDKEHIAAIEEMAHLLSESFSRLDEFRHLEERNRELEIGLIERAQAELALRESEEKLRSVVENAPSFIMTLDLSGNILFVNRMPEGHGADSILGLSIYDFALEKDRKFLSEHVHNAAQIGHSVAFEIEVLAPWGDKGWFECRVGPVKRDGRIAELTLIAQDITARKQAEQSLLQSHEQLEHQVAERTTDLKIEINERKRRETQLQVLQDIRFEMWSMRRKEDLQKVLAALKKGLEALGVSFTECGINHVDSTQDPPIVRSYIIGTSQWIDSHQTKQHPILDMWRGGEIVYRRDLLEEDPMGENAWLSSYFDHPVRSIIDVPFEHGTLALNSHLSNAFSSDDIAVLSIMAQVLSEAFNRLNDMRAVEQHTQALESEVEERQRAEEEIKRSLAEKEVLLQEIHHRVKNNLQIVSSLIDLQARHTQDAETLEMFRESRDRIRTMALVHEKLYQSNDLAHIDLPGYIRTLATDLMHSYSISSNLIECDIHIDDIALGIDMAIPCGLIINELLSNALKYAFPDNRSGRISLELRQTQPGNYLLRVADDGTGLPEGMDYAKTDSLGLKLVVSLVRQLRGKIELLREGGTTYEIRFAELHAPSA